MAPDAPAVPRRQLFIDGEWREPVLGKRIPVINPATEAIIGDVPAGTAEDVELAVDAARRALTRNKGRDWSRATGAHRAKFLRAIAAKITERKSEFAKLEALDCGKPFDEAAWDVDDVAACFEYYADLGEALDGKQRTPISLPMETFKCYVLKEPIGVVALITPWNYPLLMAAWKVAPALAAGCTAILKPSELSSVTCLELAEVCKEVGLPPGVLNIVTGLGPEAGAPLASHPQIDKIAFTGSTETGRRIMTAAAQLIKPVSLELGGKSPIIIFEDVDIDKGHFFNPQYMYRTDGRRENYDNSSEVLIGAKNVIKRMLDNEDRAIIACKQMHDYRLQLYHFGTSTAQRAAQILSPAVEWALFGCFWTNGQICSATSRLLLHESIAEEFLKKLVSWAANIKLSDPFEEGCRLGPVVSEGQYEKIKKFISAARNEGATILYGGQRPQHLEKGFFIEPTIITNVETSMQIWREEVFGPVLCVKTFSTEDEAIDMANDTHYGLAGAVISKDPERCNRLTEAIQAGIIWVNCSQPCFCQAPWGGNKRSGFGRELGEWGLENYLSVKQVTEYTSQDPWGWYPSPSKL